MATAGDVNGDGYADVIVGAFGYDNGQADEGRAFVYHGSAGGLSGSAAWTAESDQAGAWFGSSVATAGDVNGDGYADVIVGAPYYDNGQTDEGRAFVYHGSAGGLSGSVGLDGREQPGGRLLRLVGGDGGGRQRRRLCGRDRRRALTMTTARRTRGGLGSITARRAGWG